MRTEILGTCYPFAGMFEGQVWDLCCPRFSTDIVAEWQVIEHLIKQGFHLVYLKAEAHNAWYCQFSRKHEDGVFVYDSRVKKSAALAICIAALRAVEEDV